MVEDRRPKDDRERFFLSATLLVDSVEQSVVIRDLSAGGALIEKAAPAPAGARIQIEIRNIGWVHGTVAWSHGNKAGIKFDEPIEPLATRGPTLEPEPELETVPQPDANVKSQFPPDPASDFYVVRWMKGNAAIGEVRFKHLVDAKDHARQRLPLVRARKGATAAVICDVEGVTYFVYE